MPSNIFNWNVSFVLKMFYQLCWIYKIWFKTLIPFSKQAAFIWAKYKITVIMWLKYCSFLTVSVPLELRINKIIIHIIYTIFIILHTVKSNSQLLFNWLWCLFHDFHTFFHHILADLLTLWTLICNGHFFNLLFILRHLYSFNRGL